MPCAEMRQCINASLQRIRVTVSSLQTTRRKRRPWWTRRTQMDKYSEKHRLLDSKNSIRLCRSFQKVKKSFFIIFWRLFFLCISVLICTLTKKVHGNFRFPLSQCYQLRNCTWKFPCYFPVICEKIHENVYVHSLVLWRVKVHGYFHVPLSCYLRKGTWKFPCTFWRICVKVH